MIGGMHLAKGAEGRASERQGLLCRIAYERAYEAQPLPKAHLTSAEILRFRDEAWRAYFTNPAYLTLVEQKFGAAQRRNVEDMARIQLRRRLLEEQSGAKAVNF